MKNRAFTLIELLVVVLIIGILAAIALPQYQLAVAKARVATVLPMVRSLSDAVQAYYLANSQYPTKLADIDGSLPQGGSYNTSGDTVTYPHHQKFRLCADCYSVMGFPDIANWPNLYIEFYHDGRKVCWADKESSLEKKICGALMGKSQSDYSFDRAGYDLNF